MEKDDMPTDNGTTGNTSSLTVSSEAALVNTEGLSKPEPKNETLDDLHVTDPMAGFDGIDELTSHVLYQQFYSIVECKDFLDWAKQPSMLWISAGPGRGKTMLLMGIARQLSINASPNPNKPFLSYHFCGQEGPGLDTPATILKSLIWMILRQQPKLASHLEQFRLIAKRKYFDDPDDFVALSGIFLKMVRDDNMIKTHLLVDAMDECFTNRDDPSFNDLMNLVMASTKWPKIKWLISTRPTAKNDFFFGRNNKCFHLDLNSNHQHLSETLEGQIISSKISKLAKEKGYGEILETEIVKKIQARREFNSLWLEIVCRALQEWDSGCALAVLVEMPYDVEQLYDEMNRRISEQPRKDSIFCKEVLDTMAIALQPLHIIELAAILDLREGQSPVDTMAVVRKCLAFLEMRDGVVRFIHGSAKDYSRRHMLESNHLSDVHAKMAKRLLGALSRILIESTKPMALYADQHKILPSIRYASIYWIWHMNEIEDIDKRTEITECAASFLSTHFLPWMRILGPEWRVTKAATLLLQLERSLRMRLKSTHRSRILPALRGAHQLLRFHQSLDKCPNLSRSLSTMLYCPGSGLINEAIMQKAFPWILTSPIHEVECSKDFLTLHGHDKRVSCIEFSPDGRLIASGSHDSTVRIWDTRTGNVQRILRHKHKINCLAISTTGLLASGSWGNSVRLWKYATGRLHYRELSKLPGPAAAVSFSPEGKYLIAACHGDLYMWDLSTDVDEAQKLTGHPELYIFSVAFSHDGSLITAGAECGRMYLWDTESRAMLRRLEGHVNVIPCVVFSPISRRIASGSLDGTVKIWNADTGEIEKTFSAGGNVNSLAFSPCGSRLSMAVRGPVKLIKVLDIASWEIRQELQGHDLTIHSVSFAPNGKFLASSSSDGTIRFWYDEPDESRKTDRVKQEFPHYSEHCIGVETLAIADDGSYVASSIHNQFIRLWDGETGRLIQTRTPLDRESTAISPTFSPDGRKLVFRAWGSMTAVFYLSEGKLLRRSLSRITATAFSPDSRFVASSATKGIDGNVARVWDLESEEDEEPQMLENHTGHDHVAFSNDGLYLATAGCGKVWLWARPSSSPSWELKDVITIVEMHEKTTIRSMVFFPDSNRILLALDYMIEIWDIQNEKQCVGRVGLGWTPTSLWFDPRSTEYVMTDRGAQSLKSPSSGLPEPPDWAPYNIWHDEECCQYWITWKDKKVIYIPWKFHPNLSRVRGHKVVLGCRSGLTLIFKFSTEIPPL
ncbi:hypothetical protein O1611_g4159 [Lasiodiplodia mahajangana]|uniref:Uncharacterized protein n=1 Tax=Lasiodiplodia mahajangana TaxID=1108764 RepID=A0ACC2JQK3_9PEZI|nr:hypothetical protein O1611_g4159 [Lasiodiplodia mahajangana]